MLDYNLSIEFNENTQNDVNHSNQTFDLFSKMSCQATPYRSANPCGARLAILPPLQGKALMQSIRAFYFF